MEEELVMNTIQSVYNHKPKILSSFQRNNRKVNTNYRQKIQNYLKGLNQLNNVSIEISKFPRNNINEFYQKYFSENKDGNNYRYKFNTLNNKINHSFLKYKKSSKIKPNLDENEKTNLNVEKQDLIKRDKIVYLLRKLYIILPNDKMKSYKNFYSKLQFNFYFPTEVKSKKIIDVISSGQKDDIICNNLKDIFFEVYKYLKLSIKDFVKLEIYDENFNPIKLESQLVINKKRIIYVKITNISDEKINLWKQRLKSRMFFSNFIYLNKNNPELIKLNYIYNDVSTEINPSESKSRDKIRSYSSIPKKIIITNPDYNANYYSQETDNSTRYNTISQINERKKPKEIIKFSSQNKKNQKIIISKSSKRKINNINVIKIKNSQNLPFNNIYLRSFNKTDGKNDEQKEIEKNKLKINKKIFSNIIKRSGNQKNTLIPSILFDFDVTDIINNKYVLKYISNKNREKQQESQIQFKNKFEIKTMNIEDSNSKREKKMSVISNVKTYLIDKNKNINDSNRNTIIDKNKKLLNDLIFKINDFLNNNIDKLISDEEIEDFKYLSCNYVLMNELKEFPLLKLKKKFVFFVYLSQKMVSKYGKFFENINFSNDFLNNILKNEEFEKSLSYLNNIYNNIINRINYLIGYLRAINIELKISFVFFLLFIFYNNHLIEKNPANQLIYISLECIDISINSEITVQQYCDYNLLMTRNNFISYNKKFNFIKDLILRVFMSKRFNIKNSIKLLEIIFNDINVNKIMKILNVDMCSVKSRNNINIYDDSEKIYETYINYMER